MLYIGYMKRTFSALLVFALLFLVHAPLLHAASASSKAPFKETMSAADLKEKYQEADAGDKVRILVVPGHEPGFGGTQYDGYYERELVVPIADTLATELRKDPRLEVLVARGNEGWNDDLDRYFDRSMKSVKKFVDAQKKAMHKLLKKGKIEENDEQASHNAASEDVALRLYGITKWANDHEVDLMVHIHLNDTGGHADDEPGAHTGLTIYVPDRQYGNAKASRAIAVPVFKHLNAFNATSTLPIEDKGIVEDQELIALGAYNTSEVPSLLIEYGYIYEPKFLNSETRMAVTRDLAYQTARGIKEFFGADTSAKYETHALPHTFVADIAATTTSASASQASHGLYALQAALKDQGSYPPAPATLTNCPIDGVMRPCVTDAVRDFQKNKGLASTGTLDLATRNALNAIFSSMPVAFLPPAALPPAPSVIAPVAASPVSEKACAPFKAAKLAMNSTDAMTDGEVSRLQAILAKDPAVYPLGSVTGFYGPATDKAVKAFQLKAKLAAPGSAGYGLVGPATRAALAKACTN